MQPKVRTSSLRRSRGIRRLIALWRELHEASPAREVCDTELRIITENIPPLRPTASHELYHRIMDELTLIQHEEIDSAAALPLKLRHVVDLLYVIRFTPVMRLEATDLLLAYLQPWYIGGCGENILFAEGTDPDLSPIEGIGEKLWQYLPVIPHVSEVGWHSLIGRLEGVERQLRETGSIPTPPLHERILREMRSLVTPHVPSAEARQHVQS